MGYDGTHAGKSKVVQHGFRSLFADVMTENRRGVEVIRKALGHTVKDKTVRAYFRADMLQERREKSPVFIPTGCKSGIGKQKRNWRWKP